MQMLIKLLFDRVQVLSKKRTTTRKTLQQKAIALCWGGLGLIPNVAQAVTASDPPLLGVVQSQENIAQWQQITTRLQAMNASYRLIEVLRLTDATPLQGLDVLFLPGIATLSPPQMRVIEGWVNQGGKIIASGPVGDLSPLAVRSRLRSLLGAYWAFPLSNPAQLQQGCNQNQACPTVNSPNLWGGVVVPTGLNSRAIATWNADRNLPAIVTSDRATFLGWNWGGEPSSSQEFDTAWLQTVLKSYGKVPPPPSLQPTAIASRPPIPTPASAIQQGQQTRPPIPQPGSAIQRGQQLNSPIQLQPPTPPRSTPQPTPKPPVTVTQPTPKPPVTVTQPTPKPPVTVTQPTPKPPVATTEPKPPVTVTQPTPKPPVATTEPKPPVTVTQPTPKPPVATTEPTPISPRNPSDPTDLLAATSSPVATSQQRISGLEVLAMRQDMETLIGRVESSRLAANAAAEKAEEDQSGAIASAVIQARQALQVFQTLVEQQDYDNARQQFNQAKTTLLAAYQAEAGTIRTAEIRAMWLDRGTIIRAGSEAGLAKLFDRFADAGINTVFFETVNAGYPIYPSAIAPQQNPLVRGWNPLASAVKLAHARGIELHAWVWTFAAGNQRHNRIIGAPANYPGPILNAHPNWASYDNRGNLIPPGQEKPFLDPANPEVRRYLLSLLEEIATQYQVDGIQLDYIRYPFQDPSADRTYGYGQAARDQFKQQTGVDPIRISSTGNSPLWQKWTNFRVEQINTFVAEAARLLKNRRPGLTVSVAVFPLSEHDRIHKLQQHWEVWARRGDVDLVVPMTYALDTYRFRRLAMPWIEHRDLGATLIVPGIRLLNLPEENAIDKIQMLRNQPVLGYSLFAAENLTDELQSYLSRTQGFQAGNNPREPIPHRQPFNSALSRYNSLQREWNFLLANKQLVIRDPAFTQWRTQSNALGQALDQLAQYPSTITLEYARQVLSSFKGEFHEWMRLHSFQQPYQVQSWENRLETIESLLEYGARSNLGQQTPTANNQAVN